MKRGVLITVLFYASGFGIAGLSYAIIGNPYIHAPGIHHLLIFLTIVIGIIWTLISLGQYFFKSKTQSLKGILIANTIIILACVLSVGIPMYQSSHQKTNIPSDVVRTKVKGDTTTLYHNNNVIFMQVKDSVIFDLR